MAEKRAVPKKADVDQPVRICFERIVPEELDPEVNTRRNLRRLMVTRESRTLNADDVANVARIALINSKKWPTGAVLKCRFLDGGLKMRRGVEAVAHQWEQHAKIKFKFVSSGTADIRISFFADAGSWSAVGRDATNTSYFPLHQPTMNYGWLRDSTPAAEYSRVVLHEFGHALGCIHEHQQPKFDRVWNKQAVLKYFQGPPNFWSPADIEHNVLAKYSPKGITATQFDPKSIMLYAFDGALFSDGKGPTNNNTKLSAYDIQLIKSMYS
jgi:serralysin